MTAGSIEIRFLSARDVAQLSLSQADVLAAVEAALRAQGEGDVVLEPREHLVPDPDFHGHFNLLRAYVAPLGVAGVKVVGDYADNYRLGLPSELALLTLYDRIRTQTGTTGTAMLKARQCQGCRIELYGSELATVRNADPHEVVRCENCGRILVRTPESGL